MAEEKEEHSKLGGDGSGSESGVNVDISAGNLFKFCLRAITEYQVAVSD